VVNNRLAEQVTFPLEGDKFRDLPTLVDRARAHTLPAMSTLEQRTRDVLMKSENNMSTTAVLTDAEKKLVQAMSAQEARSKMAELRRVRIVLDSKEAKYRHWKKIKAKGCELHLCMIVIFGHRFHRRLNRMMRNRLVKEYEQLKDRDPAAADEKLQELETARVMVCLCCSFACVQRCRNAQHCDTVPPLANGQR
jgi:tRNA A37 N6-isopentenylltransferase MiaA